MVRGKDACWEHCVLVDASRQKVRCNYCRRDFSGGVYRMKFHLARIRNKDIVPCSEVPDDIRDHIRAILSTPKKQKNPTRQMLDPTENGQQSSSSASGVAPPNLGQNGGSSPPLLFAHRSQSPEPVIEDVQREKRDDADVKIAKFFFQNSVSFSAAKSFCYQEMVDAIAECGAGYKPPTFENLRSSLLEKVKDDINARFKLLREEWKETGCTILCECWSNGLAKSVIVLSVTCRRGTLFLRSVDVSGREDDPHFLSALLESVVLEVGLENVVQVITESFDRYVFAGRLLVKKYPSIFWSPCASHCINKILEDFGKLEWLSTVLEEAKTITRYIYGNECVLNIMRKFTGGRELIRPKISRFVSNFLSLRALVIQVNNLRDMFSHPEGFSSINSRSSDGQAINSLLYSERFWKSAREAVAVSEPLLKLLRVVDGDMPAMGYVYEGIERAKMTIRSFYKGIEDNYIPLWDIIDGRWNSLLHSPLHAAAAFLNPSIFYNMRYKMDSRMRNGFQEAMMKMACEDKDKVEMTKEHPLYINAQGALGTEFAVKGRTLNSPGDWWAGYGYEIPTLQRAAIRILSQPCSLHWCRWKWSTFESVHTKRRNQTELEKYNDLVFVHCNLWLQGIVRSRDKCIDWDEVDVSEEWPTEAGPSSTLLDDSWLDNFP